MLPDPPASGSPDLSESYPVVRRASWLRLAVVPAAIGVALAPSWAVTVDGWPRIGPLGALLLVPILAAVVGGNRLGAVPPGPRIHDRQLDLIVCLVTLVAAVTLLLLAPHHPNGPHAAVAGCLMAAAMTAAGWGSRALWQTRWAVMFLLLSWQAPWAALIRVVNPGAEAGALALAPVLRPGSRVVTSGGRALVDVPTRAVAVDPGADGGVLLLVVVGVLAGLAAALCLSGVARRAGAVVLGTAGGGALALNEWATRLSSVRGDGSLPGWTPAALAYQLAAVVCAVLIAVTARRLLGGGRRATSGETGIRHAARRLEVAVPGSRVATVVVVVAGVVLALVAGFSSRMPSGSPPLSGAMSAVSAPRATAAL